MKKLIQRFFKPKILLLIFWLAAVFIAIATMPNIEQISTDNAVSQIIRQPADQTSATKMQAKWGRGLSKTNDLTLVFHNSSTSITKAQQKQILLIIAGLKKNAAYFNINHVRSVRSSQADQHNLVSPDGSTELVELAIDGHQTRSPILAAQLQRAGKVKGLNTYATSGELIQHYQSLQLLIDSLIILLVVALLIAIIIGIVFKSVLLPLIYLLTSAVSGIVTINLAGNAYLTWHWPFDQASLLWIGLTTLLSIAWMTWRFAQHLLSNQLTAKQATLDLTKSGLLTWITLIAITGGFVFAKLSTIGSIYLIGLTLLIAGIAATTVNYALGTILGVGLQWPGEQLRTIKPRVLWQQLSHFSLWQPAWAAIIALVILSSNALLITKQFSYNPLNDRAGILSTGPITGNQVINDHFGAGKATPITLYLQNDQALTSQKSLQTIDTLTTKLKSVKGVAKVTSVTQPAGSRFEQYYVGNQLDIVQSNLTAVQAELAKNQKSLRADDQSISRLKMKSQVKNLKTVQKQVDELTKLNTRINNRLEQATSRTDNLASRTKRQRRVARNLQKDLTKAQNKANSLDTLLTTVTDNQTSLVSDYQYTRRTVNSLSKQLQATVKSLGQIDSNVNDSANFIKGLKASAVGNMFYITDSAYNSDLFTQSLTANTSANGKITKLVITLKQAPTSHQSLASVNKIKSLTKDTLLASPIAHAKTGYQGVTITQERIQHQFKGWLLKWWLISLATLFLILWIGLKSATLAQLITVLAALLNLASIALAQSINTLLLQRGPLNWETPLLASIALDACLLILVVPAIWRNHQLRSFQSETIETNFANAGQSLLPFVSLAIVGLLPLLWSHSVVLIQIAMTVLIGLVLIAILAPLLMPAWLSIAANPITIKWRQLFKRQSGRHSD